MPSTSKPQQRLALAALHGAAFPKAKKMRETMSVKALREFATRGPLGKH